MEPAQRTLAETIQHGLLPNQCIVGIRIKRDTFFRNDSVKWIQVCDTLPQAIEALENIFAEDDTLREGAINKKGPDGEYLDVIRYFRYPKLTPFKWSSLMFWKKQA